MHQLRAGRGGHIRLQAIVRVGDAQRAAAAGGSERKVKADKGGEIVGRDEMPPVFIRRHEAVAAPLRTEAERRDRGLIVLKKLNLVRATVGRGGAYACSGDYKGAADRDNAGKPPRQAAISAAQHRFPPQEAELLSVIIPY